LVVHSRIIAHGFPVYGGSAQACPLHGTLRRFKRDRLGVPNYVRQLYTLWQDLYPAYLYGQVAVPSIRVSNNPYLIDTKGNTG